MKNELIRLCDEIAAILESNGYKRKAIWMAERSRVLREPGSELTAISYELHQVTLGMGGLYDLEMHPPSGSSAERTQAREKLDELATRLSIATKTAHGAR